MIKLNNWSYALSLKIPYIYGMKQNTLDLYTDYLSVSFGYATAIGLSKLLDGDLNHDQVTRALSDELCTSKHLWQQVKPTLRQVESDEGYLIFGIKGTLPFSERFFCNLLK